MITRDKFIVLKFNYKTFAFNTTLADFIEECEKMRKTRNKTGSKTSSSSNSDGNMEKKQNKDSVNAVIIKNLTYKKNGPESNKTLQELRVQQNEII